MRHRKLKTTLTFFVCLLLFSAAFLYWDDLFAGNNQSSLFHAGLSAQSGKSQEESFSFIFVSDMHINQESYSAVGLTMNSIVEGYPQAAMIINAGDMVDDWEDHEMRAYFLNLVRQEEWPAFYTAWGEMDNPSKQATYFDLPSNGPSNIGRQFYSVDHENAHFVFMSSTYMGLSNSVYVNWLQQDLDAAQAEWNIVVVHFPLYPVTGNENLATRASAYINIWEDMLLEAGVDLVLFGHENAYARSLPIAKGAESEEGIVYLMANTGLQTAEELSGSPLYAVTYTEAPTYCIIDVAQTYIRVTAYDTNGNIIDQFDIY